MYLGRVVEQAPVDAIFHDSEASRTRAALLRSIPRIRSRTRERLTPIAGSVPHPYDRPDGLPVPSALPATSCRARAISEAPVLQPVGDSHTVSCFLYRMSATRRPLLAASSRTCRSSFRSARASCSGRSGHVRAVDGVDFHIDEGETLASSARAAAARPRRRAASCAPSSRPAGQIIMRVADGAERRARRAARAGAAARCGARCR